MDSERFLILAAVCAAAHGGRMIYEILKHRKRITPTRRSFVIVFTDMMLLWISWFGLCSLDPYTYDAGVPVRIIGFVLWGGGAVLFFTALVTIKALETYEGELMTRGIYSKIRHPMYLGFLCWIFGPPIANGALAALVLAIPFAANVLFWRHLEELELLERFPAYREYRKTTLF